MGVVSDLVSNVGHMFGIGGGLNQYQAQGANLPQMDFATAIKQAMTNTGGISGQQQALLGKQQNMADMLGQQAAGNGPSLAQPLLQQATDQNTQQSAGMIASQRGMNAGNAQRQIMDQRAGIQQQGAGQMAVLRNQEQLNAEGMQAGMLGQMGQTLGTMGQQNLGLLTGAGAMNQGQNSLALQNALGTQDLNAGVAKQNADITSKAIGGMLNGAGSALSSMGSGGPAAAVAASSGAIVPGKANAPGDDPDNDTVPGMLSPGEIVLPRSVAQAENAPELAAEFVRAIRRKSYAKGGIVRMAQGGKVPEQGYGKVLSIQREHEQRLKRLEATRKAMGK